MKNFNYHNPERLIFGEGVFEQLATLPMPGTKALIVVTPERFYVDQAAEYLKRQGIDSVVFDEVRPNPYTSAVDKAAELARKEGCDFLIPIGGGSAIDSAKAISIVMKNGGHIWDYMAYHDDYKEYSEAAPIVAVSTTSGTGTEADCVGIVANDELNAKVDIANEILYPYYSIVDPALQVTLPPALTACQGMDVIYHVLEVFLHKDHNPYGDMTAKEGMKYAAKSLIRAYEHGDDIEARADMAIASNLAGIAMSCAETISLHAMSHAIGGINNKTPHGVALSIIAPETLEYYLANGWAERLGEFAECIGLKTGREFVDYVCDTLKKVDLWEIDIDKYGINLDLAHDYAVLTTTLLEGYCAGDITPMTLENAEAIFVKAIKRHMDQKG